MNDIVNQPAHYTAGGIECIDALEAATEGLQGQEAFCTANAIKYLWRWKRKNGSEDLKKARWYINRLLSALEPAPAPTVEIEDTYGVCESPQEPRWPERVSMAATTRKGYRHLCDGCGTRAPFTPDNCKREFIDCASCGHRVRGKWHG